MEVARRNISLRIACTKTDIMYGSCIKSTRDHLYGTCTACTAVTGLMYQISTAPNPPPYSPPIGRIQIQILAPPLASYSSNNLHTINATLTAFFLTLTIVLGVSQLSSAFPRTSSYSLSPSFPQGTKPCIAGLLSVRIGSSPVIADRSACASSSYLSSPAHHSTLTRSLSDCSGLSRSGHRTAIRSTPPRYPSAPSSIYSLAPIYLLLSVLTLYSRSCTTRSRGFCITDLKGLLIRSCPPTHQKVITTAILRSMSMTYLTTKLFFVL